MLILVELVVRYQYIMDGIIKQVDELKESVLSCISGSTRSDLLLLLDQFQVILVEHSSTERMFLLF